MKPLKGVIKHWGITNDKVVGICECEVDDTRPGGMIVTSRIVSITSIDDLTAKRCETQNSIYILI